MNKEIENILYSILNQCSRKEITPFERLYIVNQFDCEIKNNDRNMVDLYMHCGCFDKALEIYEKMNHYRKIGDIYWIKGEYNLAYINYSKKNNTQYDNKYANWDRFIKLAFFKCEWDNVIELIKDLEFDNIKMDNSAKIILTVMHILQILILKC